jgi:CRP/FNR family cyclic AMP-dependent transcriptional regulator
MIDSHSLQSHALFGGITDAQMERILPHLKEETFDSGCDIVIEGNDGDRVYFITNGSVEILKNHEGANGIKRKKIAELHQGDAFGEMELIDIQNRAATVRALEPVSALSLSNKDFHQLYHEDPKIFTVLMMNLARDISRRLRKMDAIVASTLYANENSN